MFLGKVIGRLVPAVVYEGMEGVPLLWVQPLDKEGADKGAPFVCADGTRITSTIHHKDMEGRRLLICDPS